MNIIFNTNSYLGGGETFVYDFLRLNQDYMLVCSKDSWLSKKVNKTQILISNFRSFISKGYSIYF
jgi:hypothetical protein